MLLVVSLNCSVDITYQIKALKENDVNRVDNVTKSAGGKGINVAKVASQAGLPVIATGFVGGFLGMWICKELDEMGIQHDFSIINQETRNCIAVIHENNQTEILENGPTLDKEDEKAIIEKVNELLENYKPAIMILSGSVQTGISPAIYTRLMEMSKSYGTKCIVDTSGQTLINVLNHECKPYAIKPNEHEFHQLLSIEQSTLEEKQYLLMEHPLLKDIPLIMLSLGSEGAILKKHEQIYYAKIPKIDVVSAVGSGDSTIAAIGQALLLRELPENTLKRAMTYGILNSLESTTGKINLNLYEHYFNQILVEKLV